MSDGGILKKGKLERKKTKEKRRKMESMRKNILKRGENKSCNSCEIKYQPCVGGGKFFPFGGGSV
jgi:hypothetical protein